MKASLKSGLKHTARILVDETLTVPRVSGHLVAFGDMPPVFATAFLVGFIEATCIETINPHLDDGEHSVGIHVDISHVTATPVGMSVEAEVELTHVDGKLLTFRVSAYDDVGLIGEGTHKRAVIDVEKFISKVSAK